MTTTETPTTARDLIPWAVRNTAILGGVGWDGSTLRRDDRTRWCDAADAALPWAEAAYLDAFRGYVPPELADDAYPDTPLLRWADCNTRAVSLLAAMLHPPRHQARRCDRCTVKLSGGRWFRIWVPGESAAVELQVCRFCHDVTNDVHRTDPDPGGPAGRALVWR